MKRCFEFDPAKFISAPELAWHAASKNNKVKLDLMDIYLLLMAEKGIRGGICHSTYQYAKANEERDEAYFLEVDFKYLKKLHDLHNDLPYLTERMKIEKIKKLLANLHEYVIHIRNVKQALNNKLVLK